MSAPGQPSQADIYAALAAQSSFRKPAKPTAPYSAFTDPSTELITPGAGPSRVNATRVYCPREGCGSLILLEKAGDVIETDVDVLPHISSSPFPPPTPAPHFYIHVPTPFTFENIGYSRPDKSTSLPPGTPGLKGDSKGKVKWLICAECDLGPVGWGFEGGQEGWVDMRRVRYTKSEGEKKGEKGAVGGKEG